MNEAALMRRYRETTVYKDGVLVMLNGKLSVSEKAQKWWREKIERAKHCRADGLNPRYFD